MLDKIRKGLYGISEALELFMAVVVVVGIAIATITLWPELVNYWENRLETGAFLHFLDAVFNVVIGLEFIKMLCKPSSANIIEVLIFLISRHMILQTTTAMEDLLAVISIGILFLFRRFMLATKPDKDQHVPNIFGVIKKERAQEDQKSTVDAEQEKETC